MEKTLEQGLGIMPVEEALDLFREKYPQASLEKVQIEYHAGCFKYEFVGYTDRHKINYEINGATGTELKAKEKPLKPKQVRPDRRDRKRLNLENLLPLTKINQVALGQVDVDRPFEWELDRKKDRTVWKVKLAGPTGEPVYEVKVDAQEGTVMEFKLKG